MGKYIATTTMSNKREEFSAKSERAAKIKANDLMIYAADKVSLFEDDGMGGGRILATKKEGGRWENSYI